MLEAPRDCLLPSIQYGRRALDSIPKQSSSLDLGPVWLSVLLSPLANLWGLPEERGDSAVFMPGKRPAIQLSFSAPLGPHLPPGSRWSLNMAQQVIWRGEGGH